MTMSSLLSFHHRLIISVALWLIILKRCCFTAAIDIRTSPSSLQINVQEEHDFFVNDVTFQYAHKTQEWLLFKVHARPSAVSQQDLDDLGKIFLQAYQGARNSACEERYGFADRLIVMLHADIHTNEIQSFATQNRDIGQLIEFSFLVKVYFDCVKCEATGYFFYDPPATLLNDPYQNPFPSHLIQPTVPRQKDVIDRINLYLQTPTEESSNNGALAPSDTIRRVISADVLHHGTARYYTCDYPKLFTPIPQQRGHFLRRRFTTHYTLAFRNHDIQSRQDCQSATAPDDSSMNHPLSPDHNCLDYDEYLSPQLEILKPIVIETYNQINLLNPDTCDPYSRIATDATFRVVDVHRDPTVKRTVYDWIFLSITLEGICIGCDSHACTSKDVSGHATCQDVQPIPPASVPSCYCVKYHDYVIPNAENLPTNEQFFDELKTQFDILKQEQDFTLIESSVYLIETDIPYECCGWPINGFKPVSHIRSAIQRYIDGEDSPHGNMLQCFDTSQVTDMSRAFFGHGMFNEPLTCWNTSSVTTMKEMFSNAFDFNQNLHYLDTSKVTDMSSMFTWAISFNGDISTWNTSQVTTMQSMFHRADAYNRNLRTWDTSKVTDMSSMFFEAYNFNGDISTWNTSQVTTMQSMFKAAPAYNRNLRTWDTSKVTDMSSMFSSTFNFNGDISTWNTSHVTTMQSMFNNANAFNRNLHTWDTSKVTDMSWMFNNASIFNGDISTWDTSSVTTLRSTFFNISVDYNGDISRWNTSKVTTLYETFATYRRNSKFNADLSKWDTSKVKSLTSTFSFATAFNNDISKWNVSNVETMRFTFARAYAFNQDISLWDTSKVKYMSYTFGSTKRFNQPLSAWNTSQVISMYGMFTFSSYNNDISKWDTGQVTTMGHMFDHSSFNNDISKWDTGQVTTMERMFADNELFDTYIGQWNTGNVRSMYGMFICAKSFNQNIGNWNVGQVRMMRWMLGGTDSFNQDISRWNVENVENTDSMFSAAKKFNQNLSVWNIRKVINMSGMFLVAPSFGQNLCAWKDKTDNLDFTKLSALFGNTNCETENLPLPGLGPWCYTCS